MCRLVEFSMIGVFFWDVLGVVMEMNDKFLEIIGYDCDDLCMGCVDWIWFMLLEEVDVDCNVI